MFVGLSMAHPDWFQNLGLQQLFPTQAPATSSPVRVPQQTYPQQQSLPQSYSPGYQAQAAQPAVQPAIQQNPSYTSQNRAFGVAQRPSKNKLWILE